MKATIEIPDDLYRQVKAKSALEGHTIREVTIDLYEHWLEKPKTESRSRTQEPSTSYPSWYGSLHKYAKNAKSHDMDSIRESIRKGRLKEKPS